MKPEVRFVNGLPGKMITPVRIQLSRKKGWRIPENTVSVARPGKWGNPFTVAPNRKPGAIISGNYIAVSTLAEAIDCYRTWLNESDPGKETLKDARRELHGKNLACWCKLDQPCHAAVLLELVNLASARATKVNRPGFCGGSNP